MYYRYILHKCKDGYEVGLLTGANILMDQLWNLKKYKPDASRSAIDNAVYTADCILRYMAIFYQELPDVDFRLERETKSYFTDKGNRHFNKAIKALKKYLEDLNIGIEIKTEIFTDDEIDSKEIIYRDKYQVMEGLEWFTEKEKEQRKVWKEEKGERYV